MRVDWSDPAIEDLIELQEDIAKDSPDASKRQVERLILRAETLETLSRRGRRVPEADDDPNVFELFVDSFRLQYRIEEDRVLIVAIPHGRQDSKPGLGPKPWDR